MTTQNESYELTDNTMQSTSCATDDCCSTTDDGHAICVVPSHPKTVQVAASPCGCESEASGCGCGNTSAVQYTPSEKNALPLHSALIADSRDGGDNSTWQKIRGGGMLAIACLASPCCSILYVPVLLALLAGTPLAVWMGQNLGLIYGGLTILSIASFALGFRWLTKTKRQTSSAKDTSLGTSTLQNNKISIHTS